ncbi:MAG: transposase [Lachnospiraceae bacterium]|nr:transposase [Lachnospiraceae bacterium]
MEKDKATKNLEDYNDVFADIYNTLLFKERLLDEKHLESGVTETVFKAEQGVLSRQSRDVLKNYSDFGTLGICSLGIENQNYMDRNMPIRVMGYDYASYSKRLKEQDKAVPVITIVLNFQLKPWDKPRSLHETLDIPEKLMSYVQNYKIYVFDIPFLREETIDSFRSDFRWVAKFFKAKRLNSIDGIVAEKGAILHHTEEFLHLLKVFTGNDSYDELWTELKQMDGIVLREGAVEMCNLLDAFERRGMEKGRQAGIELGRSFGIENGKLSTLWELVGDGLITTEIAAKKAGLSEEKFMEKIKGLHII